MSRAERLRRARLEQHRWKMSLLRAFVATRGWKELRKDTVVPPGVHLFSWVHQRRQEHRAGTLDDWLVREAEAIPGWSWDPVADRHRRNIDALRRFVRAHGWGAVTDTMVLADMTVAHWVRARRQEHKRGVLADWIVRALEAIPGWSWDPITEQHRRMLAALRDHISRRGWDGFRQTTRARTGARIGKWASHLRELYHHHGGVPPWLFVELEKLPGWSWEPIQARQRRMLALLRGFTAERGWSALRQKTVVDGVRLGAWVNRCRTSWKRGRLPAWLATELDRTPGWSWGAASRPSRVAAIGQ